jgi:hypothetical protein
MIRAKQSHRSEQERNAGNNRDYESNHSNAEKAESDHFT